MKFESLRLRNFRNYQNLSLEFPPGVVVFFGSNGQGKTNLMEAFYFLLRGTSFRPCSTESLMLQQQGLPTGTALVEGRVSQGDLTYDLRVTLENGRKTALCNGNRANSSYLSKQFPVVLFSPESLAAIKEGPEQRRSLVDDVVAMTGGEKTIKAFKRALKTRNRILKDYRQGLLPNSQAQTLLESLDASFLPLAAELTMLRLEVLLAIQDDFRRAAEMVLETPAVDVRVDYLISGQNASQWSRSDLLSAMHKRGLELRAAELAAGVSLVGPQRHDIRILFTGKDSRFFCSQGQQRALILSFKMAQILYHSRAYQVHPFLLLDDVLSELDPAKRSNLVKFLKGIPAQIFLTTTELSFATDFGDRKLHVFEIEKAAVRNV